MADMLLTDEEITKHELPDGDYDITGLLQAQLRKVLEGLKEEGLYGEYLEDYIISVQVKPDDPDWAEDFLKRIETKGWLVFIGEE